MKIKKISISNFRSLDEVSITFVNDLMSIVGRNDVGKSTFIKAVETFYSKRTFEINDFPFKSLDGETSIIEFHFITNETSLDEYIEGENFVIRQIYEKRDSKVLKTIECLKKYEEPTSDNMIGYSDLKKVGVSLGISFPKTKPKVQKEIDELRDQVLDKVEEMKGSMYWVDITKEWADIKRWLPEIVSIPAVQDPENEQKMTSDSSAFGSLFRVGLRKLLYHDHKGQEAVTLLESKMEEINQEILYIVEEKLKTQGNAFSLSQQLSTLDVAKSFSFQMGIEDEHGIKTPLSQRGNGLQRSVLMAIIRAQSDINKKINKMEKEKEKNDNSQGFETDKYFYLIEEPEAFLHLAAQRELYYSLKELITDDSQALITTHSTLFMDEGDIDQVVLLHREEGKTSATQALEIDDVKENIGEIVQVSQLMTGKVCCLVEGIADVNAFREWLTKLGYNYKELGIYFIDMKGCQNAEYYANVKVIKDFKVEFLVVLDTDFHSKEQVEALKKGLLKEHKVKDHQVVVLQKGEIENYFPVHRVEEVLRLNENSIDQEAYKQDPKGAMEVGKEKSSDNNKAKKYRENRDSGRIAQAMERDEIDPEIVEVINRLVKKAGGEIIE